MALTQKFGQTPPRSRVQIYGLAAAASLRAALGLSVRAAEADGVPTCPVKLEGFGQVRERKKCIGWVTIRVGTARCARATIGRRGVPELICRKRTDWHNDRF